MVEQLGFASIHDPIYVRLGFMAGTGGGGGTERQIIGDLEKYTLQIFPFFFAIRSSLCVHNCLKGQPCVGKTDVLLDRG